MIQTHQLSYAYGRHPVLHELNLQVPSASIFGFLGPNGSGKTTTIRLLMGLIHSPPETVHLFDQSIRTNRLSILNRVGSLIESPSLYNHLSGRDNLEIIRRARQVDRLQIDQVLAMVQLTKDAHRNVSEYSLGMRQRLGIAIALLGNPDLLILDEPTNGLDPAGIRQIRELLVALSHQHGKTIFVSSHLLGEMEKIATHLAILNQGHLLFQGTMTQLRALQLPILSIDTNNNQVARQLLLDAQFRLLDAVSDQLQVAIRDRVQIASINQLLMDQGLAVYGLQTNQQTLEELFLTLTHAHA
ncbi:ATP-binding cassette domain-containing protein [Spirosoma endbachense]|uniref:ATP-binding cassette domain-containing protein n=1 Tax=Spirosoma endbachense TaxID=2666025 RepID=A0A6P1WBU6_9BACT|nr:ATP-binding cassette domain-containing protein [Spirosoma endbachense]